MECAVRAVGFVKSPFADKFAVPRQPGLAPHALSKICFYKPFGDPKAFEGLEGFSHLHVIFLFDRIQEENEFRPMVRPPRLGGNRHVGVWATRSPFRPSRLGLSAVKLEKILHQNGECQLVISGADLVDGTPVLDIKPYIPFVDSIGDAQGGFASAPPPTLKVEYTAKACAGLCDLKEGERLAVTEILSQDPRPAYKKEGADAKIYKAVLYQREISFCVRGDTVFVLDALKS